MLSAMKTITAISFALLAGCGPTDGRVFTLYRNSVMNEQLRIHIATFDADENEQYNNDNCNHVADLFRSQPGLGVRYWCEKGRFKR